MNTDDKIRQCFRELRDDDVRRVPPFRRVARAPVRTRTVPWLQLAVAVLVMAAVAVALTFRHRPAPDTAQWEALSTWNAATDQLLTVPSTPWESSVRTPTDSWIESVSRERQ